MPRIAYINKRFNAAHLEMIQKANDLCASYQRQGYKLSLRQLYYQFVARDWISNTVQSYGLLGRVITAARRAGLFDWDYLEDRSRNIRGGDGWMEDPAVIIEPDVFRAALWEGQTERAEVWVEKDALVDVVGQAVRGLRVAYFSCRGYTSDSEVWVAAQRLERYIDDGAESVTIFHLGDHDPSGIDMTRDIRERIWLFMNGDGYDANQVEIKRIALNMDQVEQYSPPPNPAKSTDSRFAGYIREYGYESWELDALEPSVLAALIQANVAQTITDTEAWDERKAFEEQQKATLKAIKSNYSGVVDWLREAGKL
jgi:hypothetical protein